MKCCTSTIVGMVRTTTSLIQSKRGKERGKLSLVLGATSCTSKPLLFKKDPRSSMFELKKNNFIADIDKMSATCRQMYVVLFRHPSRHEYQPRRQHDRQQVGDMTPTRHFLSADQDSKRNDTKRYS